MIVLAGGDLVLPDRVVERGSLVIDDGRIVAVDHRSSPRPHQARVIDAEARFVVPGFVEVFDGD